jgi:hypothetical protein
MACMRPVSSPELERWLPEARALSSAESPYAVPLDVLFVEAVEVARFHDKYWATVRDGDAVVRRGLDLAAGKPGGLLGPETGEAILSLLRAATDAQTNSLLACEAPAPSPMKRGLEVLDELRAVTAYVLDDEVGVAQIASLVAGHRGKLRSLDGLAVALDDFAGLAECHREALDGFGGFSAQTIDEARALADALRLRPQFPTVQPQAARDARDLRDRLIALLYERMREVRAAARFVFRGEPEIVREATSGYERRRRAAKRRRGDATRGDAAAGVEERG